MKSSALSVVRVEEAILDRDAGQIVEISFIGERFYARLGATPGETLVALKPICENLGLEPAGQTAKAKGHPVLGPRCVGIYVPTAGGPQQTLALPLDLLNFWLATISPNRVRPDLRDKLVEYQTKCADVLWRFWAGQPAPRVVTDMAGADPHRAVMVAVGEAVSCGLRPLVDEVGQVIVAIRRIDSQVGQIEPLRKDVEGLKTDMSEVKLKLLKGRVEVSSKTEAEHLAAVSRAPYFGNCPCCSPAAKTPIVDVVTRTRLAGRCHIEHADGPENSGVSNTWPTCADCNMRLRDPAFRQARRHRFLAYQDYRRSFRPQLELPL